jgi:predicted nuclease with TOPRIM domain
VSARDSARSAARRAIGVPDATEVGATLADLRSALDELHLAVTALRAERDELAAEVARQREEFLRLERAVLEQAATLEAMQSQRSAGLDR